MKIGLFFGSFNPIHIGHLAIANYMVEFTDLDQVWFVVSPHNPLKKKSTLLDDYSRLELVESAILDDDRFRVSNIEFSLPQPSYTVDTLVHLKETYPNHDFSLIMGGDNLKGIQKWKNSDILLKDYNLYVYPRPGSNLESWKDTKNINITQSPFFDISATFIRKGIKDRKNMSHFLPPQVWKKIDQLGYYQ